MYVEPESVPVKLPFKGGTWKAAQVPLAALLVQPPAKLWYVPAIDLLSDETFPVRVRIDPLSFTEMEIFWPLSVPVTGPTPAQLMIVPPNDRLGSTRLPVTALLDSSKKPESPNWRGELGGVTGTSWVRIICQFPASGPWLFAFGPMLELEEDALPPPQLASMETRNISHAVDRTLKFFSSETIMVDGPERKGIHKSRRLPCYQGTTTVAPLPLHEHYGRVKIV